jgi:hypothetical protein
MNPFDGWKSQCRNAAALRVGNIPVLPDDPRAIAWCALGWLRKQEYDSDAFEVWIRKTYSYGVNALNDAFGWTPDDFRAAWDMWHKEK